MVKKWNEWSDGAKMLTNFLHEQAYVFPLLLAVPDNPGMHPAIIYLHPDGKKAEVNPGGKIEELVKKVIL